MSGENRRPLTVRLFVESCGRGKKNRTAGSNQQCGFLILLVAYGEVGAGIMADGIMTDGIAWRLVTAFDVFFWLEVLEFDFLFIFFFCHFIFLFSLV
jgi:hypothetical protein